MDRSFWQKLVDGVRGAAPYVAAAAVVGGVAYGAYRAITAETAEDVEPRAPSSTAVDAPATATRAVSASKKTKVKEPEPIKSQQKPRSVQKPSTMHVLKEETPENPQMEAEEVFEDVVEPIPMPTLATPPRRSSITSNRNAITVSTPFTRVVNTIQAAATPVQESITAFAEQLTAQQVSVLIVLCLSIVILYVFTALLGRLSEPVATSPSDIAAAVNSNASMGAAGWGLLGLLVGMQYTASASRSDDVISSAKKGAKHPSWEDDGRDRADSAPRRSVKRPSHPPANAGAGVPTAETDEPAVTIPQEKVIATTAAPAAPSAASTDTVEHGEESVSEPTGDLGDADVKVLNRYIRAIDAKEKASRPDLAAQLIAAAIDYLSTAAASTTGALPDVLDSDCEISFPSEAVGRQYERDFPLLPADRNRMLAALLWRKARNCYVRGSEKRKVKGAAEEAQALMSEGLEAVLSSLRLYENDAEANKYAGILHAKAAKDTKEQIAAAYKIKDYTSRAVELRPHDPVLYYILGVWHYEVASLGWIQRQVASALFGSPPTSSYEEALKLLLRSEEIAAAAEMPMMSTRLKLAQTYLAMGDKAQAGSWIRKSLDVPPGVGEDPADITAQAELAKKLGVRA